MQQQSQIDPQNLSQQIKAWGLELGFQQVGITNTDLGEHAERLETWLEQKFHGEMAYMQAHGTKRSRPDELVPGTRRIISVRHDYLAPESQALRTLKDHTKGYISRYALGRDYHKVLRNKLKQLSQKIEAAISPFGYRVFVDSAPVLEKAIAEKAGLGWIGKNTLLLNKQAGSYFFLGEIFTDLPLILDTATTSEHCGGCKACMTICPTKAFVGAYQLDARRCISYLTIELKGSIPVEFRPLIGNRIFGCDDCQLICPWNRFARLTTEKDFSPRTLIKDRDLLELFAWDEATFLKNTEGSAMRRVGYECWQRNIAVALGNAPANAAIVKALIARRDLSSDLVAEHIDWALAQQQHALINSPIEKLPNKAIYDCSEIQNV